MHASTLRSSRRHGHMPSGRESSVCTAAFRPMRRRSESGSRSARPARHSSESCNPREALPYGYVAGWLQRALRQLRLGGIATVLETRLRQAQTEAMAPIDLISCLVSDELTRRGDRLLERRRKQAAFRDAHKTLDNFDFTFNA